MYFRAHNHYAIVDTLSTHISMNFIHLAVHSI